MLHRIPYLLIILLTAVLLPGTAHPIEAINGVSPHLITEANAYCDGDDLLITWVPDYTTLLAEVEQTQPMAAFIGVGFDVLWDGGIEENTISPTSLQGPGTWNNVQIAAYMTGYNGFPDTLTVQELNGLYMEVVELGDFTCPQPIACPTDDRINPQSCGYPVAIFLRSGTSAILIYAIDPATSDGELVMRLSQAEIDAAGELTAPLVLAETINPYSGKVITLYLLPTGEFELHTTYADGKPYIFQWSGSRRVHLAH